jgi:vitamin K-dependent gamma-carboxylase
MDMSSLDSSRDRRPTSGLLASMGRALFAPVDIAALVYFRIAFGLVMFWEVWRYFDHGWIGRYWIEPVMHFTYYGFDWVRPWPGNGMYLHFVGLGLLAIGITLGCWYRVCTVLFFAGFTYTAYVSLRRRKNKRLTIKVTNLQP